MSCPSTPYADVWLQAGANRFADSTVGTGAVNTLSPLMIEFRVLIFGYDIFAFGFSQFQVLTNFVDDDSTLFAFKDIRKPSICKFMAEVTKIEWFGLAFLPFVFGGSELVAHHFILDCAGW